jgi:hypothetical protein
VSPRASGHMAKTQSAAPVRSVTSVVQPMVSHFRDDLHSSAQSCTERQQYITGTTEQDGV